MKRVLSFALLVMMFVGLSGCGVAGDATQATTSTTVADTTAMSTTQPEDIQTQDETQTEEAETTKEESKGEAAYEVTYESAMTYKNSIGTVWVQVIFEVENTGGVPLYMNTGAFDLEDESGKLIKSSDMVSVYPQVIEPGEKAYYYEETTLDDLTDTPSLTVIARPKGEAAKVDNIRFPVTDFSLSDGSYGLKMLGRVENTTDEEQKMVYVAAILFDENDNPIGQLFTILMEDFAPGDKIGFEGSAFALPDSVTAEAVTRCEVFAYPSQFQF